MFIVRGAGNAGLRKVIPIRGERSLDRCVMHLVEYHQDGLGLVVCLRYGSGKERCKKKGTNRPWVPIRSQNYFEAAR